MKLEDAQKHLKAEHNRICNIDKPTLRERKLEAALNEALKLMEEKIKESTMESLERRYAEGKITLEGVYDECETDLEFYNFLYNNYSTDEYEIKDVMGSDAFNNALDLAEEAAMERD